METLPLYDINIICHNKKIYYSGRIISIQQKTTPPGVSALVRQN